MDRNKTLKRTPKPEDPIFEIGIDIPGKKRIIKRFFKKPLTIGRADDCGLILKDKTVSKNHAEIIPLKIDYLIRDLGSSNGLYVNGKRIKKTNLLRGDRLRIGRFELTFLGEKRPKNKTGVPSEQKNKSKSKKKKNRRSIHSPEKAVVSKHPPRSLKWYLIIGALSILTVSLFIFLIIQIISISKENKKTGQLNSKKQSSEQRQDKDKDKNKLKNPKPSGEKNSSQAGIKRKKEVSKSDAKEELLSSFQLDVERPLIKNCARCHDGMLGGQFVIYTNFKPGLRIPMNLNATIPFINKEIPWRSMLVLKALGEKDHAGGKIVNVSELTKIADFYMKHKKEIFEERLFTAPRPEFTVSPDGVTAKKEIELRRIFLDLIGRPPTNQELGEFQSTQLSGIIQSLVLTKDYAKHWKNKIAGPLKDNTGDKPGNKISKTLGNTAANNHDKTLGNTPANNQGKNLGKTAGNNPFKNPGNIPGDSPGKNPGQEIGRGEIASRLAEYYKTLLHSNSKRFKTRDQIAASLFIDLSGKKPGNKEIKLITNAFDNIGGDLLPLAVFFTGDVKPGTNISSWIDKVFVRFFLRLPGPGEKIKASELLKKENGAKLMVLTLASCSEYLKY